MAYNFVRLNSKRARLKEPPANVTIVKNGKTITLTRAALELIGRPESIVYLIDADAKAFAIAPANPEDMGAYPVRWQASGRTALVSFGNVEAALGLDTSKVQHIPPVLQDGMLIVDMSRSSAAAPPSHRQASLAVER